jgi:hypothetical protein
VKYDTRDEVFVAGARAWLEEIHESDITSFSWVLAHSPGYYPSTLRDLWLEELQRRTLAATHEPVGPVAAASLPVGHPLDYDWRFTEGARSTLLACLDQTTIAGEAIAYLGTPTLFAQAVSSVGDRRHVLVDANGPMVEALQAGIGANRAIQLRLGVEPPPPALAVDAAVLDPPWYPGDTLDFMEAASAMVRPGGVVLLSQPTLATRPGVQAERADLVATSGQLGFKLERTLGSGLRYVTPHFERMSLTAEEPGFPVSDDWRTGDLLVFRRTSSEARTLPRRTRADSESWREVSFGPVRMKLRGAGAGDLLKVDEGLDRLVTVSRRDPARDRVGFWTSGNRVRTLQSVEAVGSLVAMCENDLVHMTFTHSRTRLQAAQFGLDHRVADDLFEILLLEYQEHVAGGYGDLA